MEEEEVELPSSEEQWEALLLLEGEYRADVLTNLAISYSDTEDAPFAIALAEEAAQIYLEVGLDETDLSFVWVYGSLVLAKAQVGELNEAISAGVKCLQLEDANSIFCYQELWMKMLEWYLTMGRYQEARSHFMKLVERYKNPDSCHYEYLRQKKERNR